VLVFGHGHAGRVLAARWLDLPPADGRLFVLGTGTVSVLGQEHGAPAVVRWNCGR
jgi:probable phosphoglycerate mutase